MEWGPSAWKFLHTITFNYPDNPTLTQKRNVEELFLSLIHLLPCDECSEHYKKEISENFPDSRSKSALSSWLVNLHNKVNIRLNKPTMTYEAAKVLYTSHHCNSCNAKRLSAATATSSTSSTSKILGLIFLIIFGMIVVAYFAKYY